MRPDSTALLWHARDAATSVARLIAGESFAEYLHDEKLRLAVERVFTILGEALSKLRKIDPDTADLIPNLSNIVGFRNILVHAYIDVDDRVVWDAASQRAPELLTVIDSLIGNDR